MELNDTYWSSRYTKNETGWDIHQPSPPLKTYIDQWPQKDSRILIPGCGKAWEAEYLLQRGFINITLLDISNVLAEQLRERFRDTPVEVVQSDFFIHDGAYDLILEQTFFCALDPMLRPLYASKMHALLATGGTFAGVLFNRQFESGPPFGGSLAEYRKIFARHFNIRILEPCYNSIPPRSGSEAFFVMRKDEQGPRPH